LNDSWIKDRLKGPSKETPESTQTPASDKEGVSGTELERSRSSSYLPATRTTGGMAAPADDLRRSLQVLALAQRTADEHLSNAQRQADEIIANARATAAQILRDAGEQAAAVRREAQRTLSIARAREAQAAKDAEGHIQGARREGEAVLSDARARAAQIEKEGKAYADRLTGQAQLRYEEMVGNLAAKREAMQAEIEALHEFDREYRTRLLSWVQTQLRALWVDEPHVDATIENTNLLTRNPLPTGRPTSQPGQQ
jgi:cell division septum initiation protein DivIVA